MPESNVLNRVEETLDAAVGTDQRDMPVEMGMNVFTWLVEAGESLPPWWSQARDKILSDTWKKSNHLAVAVYNTQAKIVGISPRIVSKDPDNTVHVGQAEALTELLMTTTGFTKGWEVEYSKYVEDVLCQDNGGFMEVIGDGKADGPIVGIPLGVRHLDSRRCTRTSNPEFPVVYMDDDGYRWKLHWTRVIYMSQMPSSIKEMNGVGFCSVSRVFDVAQTLTDMVRYKMERLGSRPPNQIVVGRGITAQQIMLSMRRHEENLSNRGFAAYSRTMALGSENTDIGLDVIDLNHMDPFDEETTTNLAMFLIAAGFGMDAEEIWPVGGKSAGKQEANIRRMRSRGRLPAQMTAETSRQFNFKVLPPHLRLVFDFRDDEEDMQRANIRDIRGRNRERDLGTGAINVRAARTHMLEEGDIDRATFAQMELSDGRLADGKSIATLFFSRQPVHRRLLGGFMKNPLSIVENIYIDDEVFGGQKVDDAKVNSIIGAIQRQRSVVLDEWSNTTSGNKSEQVAEAFHALDWLEEQYQFAAGRILPEVPMQQRRMRTDIRVEPEEIAEGDESPAEATMPQDENITNIGE